MFKKTKYLLSCVMLCVSTGAVFSVSAQFTSDKKTSSVLDVSADQIYGAQASFNTCVMRADTNFSEMQLCIDTELVAQKQRLTRVIKQLNVKLSKNERTQLSRVMRSWHSFKDTNCRFTNLVMGGGSNSVLMAADCQRQIYTQRAKELEDIYQGVVLTH